MATGVAGTCAGQSLPYSLFRRQQEARQSPIVSPQQQCVQLSSSYRKLLRQDTYVSILYHLPTRLVKEMNGVTCSARKQQHSKMQNLLYGAKFPNAVVKVGPLMNSNATPTLFPSLQQHTTTACPWTKPCSACLPASRLGPKRETWPTTWATKQRGCTLTKVSWGSSL